MLFCRSWRMRSAQRVCCWFHLELVSRGPSVVDPLRPQPRVRPLPGLLFCGLMSTAPSAPCPPLARSSVSWAHVHCALSAPCQVFCLLGSCPLRCQPRVRPLPGLLSPGLMSTAPSAPCPPSARSSVSSAYVHCALGCEVSLSPGLMSTAP